MPDSYPHSSSVTTSEVESEDRGGKPHSRPLFCLGVSVVLYPLPGNKIYRMAGAWPEIPVCAKRPIRRSQLLVTNLKMKHTRETDDLTYTCPLTGKAVS